MSGSGSGKCLVLEEWLPRFLFLLQVSKAARRGGGFKQGWFKISQEFMGFLCMVDKFPRNLSVLFVRQIDIFLGIYGIFSGAFPIWTRLCRFALFGLPFLGCEPLFPLTAFNQKHPEPQICPKFHLTHHRAESIQHMSTTCTSALLADRILQKKKMRLRDTHNDITNQIHATIHEREQFIISYRPSHLPPCSTSNVEHCGRGFGLVQSFKQRLFLGVPVQDLSKFVKIWSKVCMLGAL